MSTQHIPSRPYVQGSPAPLRLRPSAQELTDGAGLLALRRLLDRLAVSEWLDRRLAHLPGFFRPSLLVKVWMALWWYGGGWLDDLALLKARRIRRLFGWIRVPDPTTFGRWLRRAGAEAVGAINELTRRLVRIRWRRARTDARLRIGSPRERCLSVRNPGPETPPRAAPRAALGAPSATSRRASHG